jgi:hypothetical protein
MIEYRIPISYLPYEKQIRSARLLHLLTSFLFMFNAWIDFQQPTPSLLFVVVQIACSLLVFTYVILGKKLTSDAARSNFLFRLLEITGFSFAAWYFFSALNSPLQGSLVVATLIGLLYLLLMERNIFKPVDILLNEKGIRLPGMNKSQLLPWNEIDNLRIRNDFISINTKDNRFLQFEINRVLSDTDIDEMNNWCIRHFTIS